MKIEIHPSWSLRLAVAVLLAIAGLFASGHIVAGCALIGALIGCGVLAAFYIVFVDMWIPPELHFRKGGSSSGPVNSK